MPELPFDPDLKVAAVDAFIGDRSVAWLDDAFGDAARRWARHRGAPTLLVDVDPAIGLTFEMVTVLADWRSSLDMP